MTNKYHSLYPFTYVRWESTLPDSVAAVLLRMHLLDPKDSGRDLLNPCKSNGHFYETIQKLTVCRTIVRWKVASGVDRGA